MSPIRLISALGSALVLASVSLGGTVLAQAGPAEDGSHDAALVTGTIGAMGEVQGGTRMPVGDITAMRGFVFEAPIETSDDRLTGTLVIVGGVDEYTVREASNGGPSRVMLIRNIYLLTTDDGGWAGEGTGMRQEFGRQVETVILEGT